MCFGIDGLDPGCVWMCPRLVGYTGILVQCSMCGAMVTVTLPLGITTTQDLFARALRAHRDAPEVVMQVWSCPVRFSQGSIALESKRIDIFVVSEPEPPAQQPRVPRSHRAAQPRQAGDADADPADVLAQFDQWASLGADEREHLAELMHDAENGDVPDVDMWTAVELQVQAAAIEREEVKARRCADSATLDHGEQDSILDAEFAKETLGTSLATGPPSWASQAAELLEQWAEHAAEGLEAIAVHSAGQGRRLAENGELALLIYKAEGVW
eukprot:215073-Lingulodinium_polyedra.AAC.1